MKFFKLLILSAVAAVQAKVLNFTNYEYEWVKGKEYNLQYTYLEEPSFSNFEIRLYNSTKSITLKEVSTDDYSEKDNHSIVLSYPEASTGKYKIVGISNEKEVSNNFYVKLVLKASPTTSSSIPTPTSESLTSSSSVIINKNDNSNLWKTVAIVVSIIVVLLIIAIVVIIFYNRYKKNKRYEEEANNSIWTVPISDKSIALNRGVNAYSVPNASITERDLSFSSDIDGFYSYSSQYRNPEFFSPHMGYMKERKEKTKSIYSYSTNVTKVSNNILDILYPSNEKKEKSLHERSIHEKSLHEKSELSIDLGQSHSQKGQRRKKHSNSASNGQLRSPRSKSTERVRPNSEVRTRSNSFKANAMFNRKSRVSLAESEGNAILSKKSRVSLAESEKNTRAINAALLNEHTGDIALSNNNTTIAVPISTKGTTSTNTGTNAIKSVSAVKNDKNFNEAALNPESPEYYIKHTKLNKKYLAVCNFKPSLIDEMNVTKNDVIVIHEVFTDGWGYGKNITTDKDGSLPLNCLNIEV